MDWHLERNELKNEIKNYPKQTNHQLKNSPLKKKLSLLNKLKNIKDSSILIKELKSEQMNKFIPEAVSAILSNKIKDYEDIKEIIRVLAYFSREYGCSDAIRKSVCKNLTWYWNVVLYVEIGFLGIGGDEFVGRVKEIYGSLDVGRKIVMLKLLGEYVCLSKEEGLCELINGWFDELCLDKEVGNENLGGLQGVAKCLGRDLEVKENVDFVRVIDCEEHEFVFYNGCSCECSVCIRCNGNMNECSNSANDNVNDNSINGSSNGANGSLAELIVNTLQYKNITDSAKSDIISKSIANMNIKKSILISSIIKIGKKNEQSIHILGKVINTLQINIKEKLLDAIYKNKENILIASLIISELYKLKSIEFKEILDIMIFLLKNRKIEVLGGILESLGRYCLNDKQANKKMREFLEKIKNSKNEFNDVEKIIINTAISKIFIKKCTLEEKYDDFIYWFIDKKNYNYEGAISRYLALNPNVLIYILLKPWNFSELDFCVEIAYFYKIDDILKKILFEAILVCARSGEKQKCLTYSIFLSLMYRKKQPSVCEKLKKKPKSKKFEKSLVFEKLKKEILKLEIPLVFKINVFVVFLAYSSDEQKNFYFEGIKELVEVDGSLESEVVFSDFCRENGFVWEKIDVGMFEKQMGELMLNNHKKCID